MNTQAWEIRESDPSTQHTGRMETLFSLANGHLGMRGDFEEAQPAVRRGTYVNGFFEKTPITYGERAFGYADNHQTILNLPDGRLIRLTVDGETFDMTRGTRLAYERVLDLRAGLLRRNLRWRLENGREIEIRSVRVVSMTRPETAAIRYAVRIHPRADSHGVAANAATVRLVTQLRLDTRNIDAKEDPRVGAKFDGDAYTVQTASCKPDGSVAALITTANSGLSLICAARDTTKLVTRPAETLSSVEGSPNATTAEAKSANTETESSATSLSPVSCAQNGAILETVFETRLAEDRELVLERILHYERVQGVYSRTSDSQNEFVQTAGEQLAAQALDRAHAKLETLSTTGFAGIAKEQAAYMDGFWRTADVELAGRPDLTQAVRFNIFHILQSAGKDGKSNLAAKGLSGEGYEGHYFWDTEIYALPLFTYNKPEIARALLSYRHSILPNARARAARLAHRGALYPWRTIDGEECSAYYPAGTAQYHINADIVYALRRYVEASGDRDFLYGEGAEILVETARFWMSLGAFGPAGSGDKEGKFCINVVTGPDEYTALVNNNVFTNLMAAHNLAWAAEVLATMRREDPAALERLSVTLVNAGSSKPTVEESSVWALSAERIYIPQDHASGLYPQDDSFFSKAVWDFAATPKDKYPLLLHYHPLNIYRHQVLKQPDLVLAMFMFGRRFTADEKRRNFDYYEPLTTGDSSLSHCIQSIMAAESGYASKAWDYFLKTVRLDLDDLHGNVVDGIHAAAMAGTWLSVVYGFAGFRDEGGGFSFAPRLPPALEGITLRLRIRGAVLSIGIGRELVRYALEEGEMLEFEHCGKKVELSRGLNTEVSLPA